MTGSDLLGEDYDADPIETLTTITDIALADGPQTFSYLYFSLDDPLFRSGRLFHQ